MESSRRPPFDRLRELNSLKKPRIEDPRRQLPTSGGNSPGISSGLARFRTNSNENSSEVRGAIQQAQQYQELVNQYKTALAELTFNSKPIITNLTIIAGENLQAARAIAATICANVIEVPSEQKLPSLYLLDSIVKNIGRDYITYFAAKLPEVFCKAYRQVDPSIHSGMRHLFGTWKGVFPPQQLKIIEMELGFLTAVNGSSSGSAASKTDSQSQLQSRSIHVNPKYLAARQRLQQANQPKVTDINRVEVESSEDVERPNRIVNAGDERSWGDPSNLQRSQREPSLQAQGGTGYGDYDFAPGVKRPLCTSVGKLLGQSYEKRSLGASGRVEESISTQRNGYGAQHSVSNYTGARAANTDIPLLRNPPRSSIEVPKSWKNSEEEEYKWDDLGNSAIGPGAVDKSEFSTHLKRQTKTELRSSFESSSEPKEIPFAQPRPSSPLLHQVGTRSVMGSSSIGLSKFGVPAITAAGLKASVGQHYPTSGQSLVHQHPPYLISKRDPRQSLIEKDFMKSQSFVRTDPRSASVSGQPNMGIHDLSSWHPNSQPGTLQKMPSQTLQKSFSAVPSFQQRHYVPSSDHLSNQETELTDIIQKAQKVLGSSSPKRAASPISSNPNLGDLREQSNVSNLLAAVMRSGLITDGPISGHLAAQSPATTSLTSKDSTMSSGPPDAVSISVSVRKVEKSPLLSGPSNSSPLVASTSAQTSNKASGDSNPLSILSTLISKGLISAPKTEETVSAPMINEGQLPEQSPTVATSTTVTVPPVIKSSAALPAPTNDQTSSSGLAKKVPEILVQNPKAEVENLIGSEFKHSSSGLAKKVPEILVQIPKAEVENLIKPEFKPSSTGLAKKVPEILVQYPKAEVENLIGSEFKPHVLREFHQAVIDKISDDLPHKCSVCGLRFKLQEKLAKHSEWHAFKTSIENCLNRPSRRWYANTVDWITSNAGFPFGYNSTCSTLKSSRTGEGNEQTVPADESQCVCLLCGELFEDFYCQEKDGWMFKGAVYFPNMSGNTETGPSHESTMHNMIVHSKCMSDDSVRELGLVSGIKVEKNT